MKIVTAAEMREIDRRTTEDFGVPSLTLMENAGSAVAEFCLREYPNAKTVGVICGKGNNGADGFVAARKLHEAGKTVRVLLLADPADVKGDASEMLKRLPVKPVIARNKEELKSDAVQQVFNADLLVDAMLGTGFKPPLNDFYRAAIRRTNQHWPIIAVDVPSGCDADNKVKIHPDDCVRARDIVSFTAPKPIHIYEPGVRQVVIAEIGSPPEAVLGRLGQEVITAPDILRTVMPRDEHAHKGDYGHVLVIGGSVGKAGAAAMAGMAALRAGAGLVTVACPRSVLPIVSSFAPELMVEPLPETSEGTIAFAALENGRIEEILKGKTVVAIGPGASRNQETARLLRSCVSTLEHPIVLDADGLNAFEAHIDELNGSGHALVLTPHPGEMSRLTGTSVTDLSDFPPQWMQEKRVDAARKFASEHRTFIVLKGSKTIVACPAGRVWINPTGNPGMATGGTGDILTGVIAAFIAREIGEWRRDDEQYQRIDLAVCGAVYLHGLAGDFAADRFGQHPMIATDLLACMPEAFKRADDLVMPKFTWIRGGHRARLCCC